MNGERFSAMGQSDPFVVSKLQGPAAGEFFEEMFEFRPAEFRELVQTATSSI
jgi:hypothetical protein